MDITDRIYSLWPNVEQMAFDLGVSSWTPYKWKSRAPYIPPSDYDIKIRDKSDGAISIEELAEHRAKMRDAA